MRGILPSGAHVCRPRIAIGLLGFSDVVHDFVYLPLAAFLAKAQIPDVATQMIHIGRLTALSKPDGGVRGVVAGDIIRRLVARTMAQQLQQAVEVATAPFQFALSTKAGCECVAHAFQGLTQLHPDTTITSIDGISAFDLISRESMLTGLTGVDGGQAALPFVRLFYGSRCRDRIPQGEGGKQGDALMPLLFCVTESVSWRCWTTSTWPLLQPEPRSKSCGSMQASVFTQVRPRCGTGLA